MTGWRRSRSTPFNRTTMELKQMPENASTPPAMTFNRTTMELKRHCRRLFFRDFLPFNRTTMELKRKFSSRNNSHGVRLLIEPLWNWNATPSAPRHPCAPLLIKPLWNWNPASSANTECWRELLIEPLWNWNNDGVRRVRLLDQPFNRTTMELKPASAIVNFLPSLRF